MIKVEEKEEIRKLYFRRCWSIRKIAKELRHLRKTVRRALNDPYPRVYRRKVPPPERVVGPVKHIIDTYLKEDEKKPKSKDNISYGESTIARLWQKVKQK